MWRGRFGLRTREAVHMTVMLCILRETPKVQWYCSVAPLFAHGAPSCSIPPLTATPVVMPIVVPCHCRWQSWHVITPPG